MTGPEDYAEADELLVQLDSPAARDEPRWLGLCAAATRARYTAVLAAATAPVPRPVLGRKPRPVGQRPASRKPAARDAPMTSPGHCREGGN